MLEPLPERLCARPYSPGLLGWRLASLGPALWTRKTDFCVAVGGMLALRRRDPGGRVADGVLPSCDAGRWRDDLGVGHGVDISAHHANLVVFFVEVMQQDVTQGDHADQMAFMADRKVPKAVAAH